MAWTAPLIVQFGFQYADIDNHLLIKNPVLYKFGQQNGAFNILITILWVMNGIIHSFIVVMGLSFFLGKEHALLGTVVALALAIVINTRLYLHETSKKEHVNTALIIAATFTYPLYLWLIDELWPLLEQFTVWMPAVLGSVGLCIAINFVFKKLLNNYFLKNGYNAT